MKDREELKKDISSYLDRCLSHVKKSRFSGLPELTNENGQFCKGSCETQAWSMAQIAEVADLFMKI